MIGVLAIILVATGVGVACERRWPTRATPAAELGMKSVLWVILPVVVFFNFARFKLDGEIGAGIAFGYIGVGASIGIALLAAQRLGLVGPRRGAFLSASFVANTVFLGVPVVAVLIGFEHVPQALTYDLLISAPMLLVVAFGIGARHAREGHVVGRGLRAFLTRNPGLYAAVAGLLVPNSFAPDVAVDASQVLVVAMAPIGFFALGTYASRDAGGAFRFPPPLSAPVITAAAIKLTVPFVVMLVCSALIHDVPDAYLIQAAMPVGLNSLLLVTAYRLDRTLISGAIVWSTVVVLAWALVASLVL